MNEPTANSLKLYNSAKKLMGTIVCADNDADGHGAYGCMETMNGVFKDAFGVPIGGGASLALAFPFLEDETRFQRILLADATYGDIIACITGQAIGDAAQHGHIGVIGKYGILSNNSEDAKLEEVWTVPKWIGVYVEALKFPLHIYRVK